jgi:alpha-tubulin suppressor-like RCC1 family protein
MKKLLLFLLSLPQLMYAQDSVREMQAGEYHNQILTQSGKFYSIVWGGLSNATADFGLSNIVQLGGGWHAGIVRDKAGSVYIAYKDNNNAGKAGYQTVPKDAYGNAFTGNSDCYGWMDGWLTLKNDSVYTWGNDQLGINGGKAIPAPIKLTQPAGKRIIKLQPSEPSSSIGNDILLAQTADNQLWIYPKGKNGVPYLKFTASSPITAIGAIGQGVFIVATATDILAWGGLSQAVGLPSNTQTPTSVLATFQKAGLQLPVREIASDWNSAMLLDANNNLFSIGDAVHGSTGIGKEFPDWRHHFYGATRAAWAWNFGPLELPQPYAVWVPGKFAHIRSSINQALHYYAQDLGGNWYSDGRNKGGALFNFEAVSNEADVPEWGNVPMFTRITPFQGSWPAGAGPVFDSTKTLSPRVSAGVYQYIATDTTTLYGMATQQAGSIVAWSWAKIGGPGNLSATAGPIVPVTGLNNSSPTSFQLTVTNNSGLSARSIVVVTSTASALPPAPIAKIIIDSTVIHSPTSFVRVTGDSSTGAGISYTWSQLGGPSPAIVTPVPGTKSGFLFSGLLPGAYSFQLQVKDSVGRTSLASVSVTVLPAPACPICPVCPQPRTVIGLQIQVNQQWYPVPLSWAKFALSDGSNQ